ncbi:MAG: helix-turn-helix transcriptional regulator [Candidatus Methylomirabilales bacterium]
MLPGLLLFHAQGKLLSWNSVAKQILHHQNDQGQLLQKIHKGLRNLNKTRVKPKSSVSSPAGAFMQATFSSGRRRYQLRAFLLDNQPKGRPRLVAVLLEGINPTRLDLRKAQQFFRLSPREIEAIQALQIGMTDKEIASALGISPETARGYLKTVRAKLGVSTRTAILHKLLSR